MNDNLKSDININDFINVFKLNKLIIFIFIILSSSVLVINYYFINKKYDVAVKIFCIDENNIQKIERLISKFNVLPTTISDHFIYSHSGGQPWDYDKFERYFANIVTRNENVNNVLNNLSPENYIKAKDIVDNMEIIVERTFVALQSKTKYPEYFETFIDDFIREINNFNINKLSTNMENLIQAKNDYVKYEELKLKNIEEVVNHNVKKTIKLKILMYKKQLELGIFSDTDTYIKPKNNILDMLFPNYLVENLSENQIKEQISFYEDILKKHNYFTIDFDKFFNGDCEPCRLKVIDEFFHKDNINNISSLVKQIKLGYIDKNNFTFVYLHPWKISIIAKYIILPFVLFYMILLVRYIYLQKK